MKTLVLAISCIFAFNSWAASSKQLFPEKDWARGSLKEAGIDEAKFKKLTDHLYGTDGKNEGMNTDALLVIKNGKMIYEKYISRDGIPHGPNEKHMLWSLTKPITGAIIGVAIEKGLLSLEDNVANYYPIMTLIKGKKSREYAAEVKIKHLLKMESGLKHTEEAKIRILSDAIYTYYSKSNYKDTVIGSYNQGFNKKPGTYYNYATRDPIMLMGILRRALDDDKAYNDFPWDELFDKLGMRRVTYEQDVSGNFLGGMGMWTTADSVARFAYLLLRKGKWKSEQILPTWWYKWMLDPSPAQKAVKDEKKIDKHNRDAYGALLWVNKKLKMNKQRTFPALPESMFYALGTNGQAMIILPEQDTVIIRLATDSLKKKFKERKAYRDKYMKLIGEVFVP